MIKEIRRKIQRQEYEYSLHAADQSVLRHIARREVEEAIESGAVIEDYPRGCKLDCVNGHRIEQTRRTDGNRTDRHEAD